MKKTLLLLMAQAFAIVLCAQQVPQEITQKFDVFNKNLPQEKLYFHTDRTLYAPGDDIWFSAYITNAHNHFSYLSDGFWAELIHPNGSSLKKIRIPNNLKNQNYGDFTLATNAEGGIYKIRMQTDWMLNYGNQYVEKEITVQKVVLPRLLLKLDLERESYGAGSEVTATLKVRDTKDQPLANTEFQYQALMAGKPIFVDSMKTDAQGNAFLRFRLPNELKSDAALLLVQIHYELSVESISRSIPLVFNQVDLQFLPEGGIWSLGTKQRLAFKALNHYGKPADVSGEIVDNNGKVVAQFNSYHQGMGAVDIQAQAGQFYTARITEPAGISATFDLPLPQPVAALQLTQQNPKNNELTWKIYSPAAQNLYLIGQAQGKIIYTKTITAQQGEQNLTCSLDSFPMGIAQFTLFDEQRRPLAERLVFANKNRGLQIEWTLNKNQYELRDIVNVDFTAKDAAGMGVDGVFSVAVVDDNQFTFIDDKQDNILSGLLMSRELNGYIHEPSFYFDPSETRADTALDLVLMTHGWRRFDWQEVLNTTAEQQQSGLAYRPWEFQIDGNVTIENEPLYKSKIQIFKNNEYTDPIAVLFTNKQGNFSYKFKDKSLLPLRIIARYRGLESTQSDVRYVQKPNPETLRNDVLNNQITGIVLQEKDKLPMPYAALELWRNGFRIAYTETDFMGRFAVQNLPSGDYELRYLPKGKTEAKQQKFSLNNKENRKIELLIPNAKIPIVTDMLVGTEVPALQQENKPAKESETLQAGTYSVSVTDANACTTNGTATAVLQGGTGSYSFNWEAIPGVSAQADLTEVVVMSANDVYVDGARMVASMNSIAVESVVVLPTNTNSNATLGGTGYVGGDEYIYLSLRNAGSYEWSWVTPYYPRSFYSPIYSNTQTPVNQRNDYRKTLYWNPQVRTNEQGKAQFTFCTSDATGTFRMIAEGIGGMGGAARKEGTFSVQAPFSMEARLPKTVSFGDTVQMVLIFKNNTNKDISGELQWNSPKVCRLLSLLPKTVEIPANSVIRLQIPIEIAFEKGEYPLHFGFKALGMQESVSTVLNIVEMGFPRHFSLSGKALNQSKKFKLDAPVEGSIEMEFTAYGDELQQLMGNMETMLREPYGCFEQTSSSNYPNILALQYMEKAGKVDAAIRQKALAYLDAGYKRLVSYETSEGGFEWFGHTPPHEGLTAYGLMQFYDMKKVYDKVDDKMIERTEKWLLSRRDGNGGWKKTDKFLHSWCSGEVLDAYVSWAVAEIGKADLVRAEIEKSTETALKNEDAYQMALMLLANQQAKNTEKAALLSKTLLGYMQKGIENLKTKQTITSSYGISVNVETASLVALGLMRQPNAEFAAVQKLVDFIAKQRNAYGYGSCQGTVWALKTFVAFADFSRRTKEDGDLEIQINDQIVKRYFSADSHGKIYLDSLAQYLKIGENTVSVRFLGCKEGLPFSLETNWHSLQPEASGNCPVAMKTQWTTSKAKVGETVHLDLVFQNTSAKPQPSAIAKVGIPSGLSLQPWQLKELRDKGKFDYYEIKDNYLILYYSDLEANEQQNIALDLKADIAGSYRVPVGSAYLYYTPEERQWVKNESVQVAEAAGTK